MLHVKNNNDWRFERKFFISELNRYEINNIVRYHPAMFSEIFHGRNVNNIYLDSYLLSNFFKNVDGQSQRLKVRVRWYGDLLGAVKNPVLEFKIRSGQLGRKVSYKLNNFTLDKNLTNECLHRVFEESDIPEEIKQFLREFDITLLNNYSRNYFLSADKKFRITTDFNMRYVKLVSHLHNNFINEIVDSKNNILELKYDRESDACARKITNYFPFRMTKSSKYVTGIDSLFL